MFKDEEAFMLMRLLSKEGSRKNMNLCLSVDFLVAGHASSRIGWAIVSDAKLAEALRRPTINVMSIESQIRATVILEHILGTQGTNTHSFMYTINCKCEVFLQCLSNLGYQKAECTRWMDTREKGI